VFGRSRFDRFLRAYFDRFAFQSLTTNEAIDYLRKELLNVSPELSQRVPIDEWLVKPGLPDSAPHTESRLLSAVKQLARAWAADRVVLDPAEVSTWSTHQWLGFLTALPEQLPIRKLTELDRQYQLTQTGNSEVLAQWLIMAVRNGYHPADARLDTFLMSIGRLKYIKPIYEVMLNAPDYRDRAYDVFARARHTYHPQTRSVIEKILS
jgi:leukotriene-A4 hydrolase